MLAESDLWDGRRGVLQVTDAVGGVVRVRIVVSARECRRAVRPAVREGMVDWVQRTKGGVDAAHRAGCTGARS
jgi:hypothetical protein